MVKIFSTPAPVDNDDDVEAYNFDKNLAMSYIMRAPLTFPVDPPGEKVHESTSVMKTHQIYSHKQFIDVWKVTIVTDTGLNAPLVSSC